MTGLGGTSGGPQTAPYRSAWSLREVTQNTGLATRSCWQAIPAGIREPRWVESRGTTAPIGSASYSAPDS